jgi:hypothetical protein
MWAPPIFSVRPDCVMPFEAPDKVLGSRSDASPVRVKGIYLGSFG